ncbi:unnamed protein product, partial [Ixodes pacificus]
MLRCGLLLAALCSSVLWHRVATADKPAFLLTAPHALMPGATETLALNVLNPPKDGHATIQLLAPSGQVLSETSVKSAGGFPQTVSLNVPKELPVGSSLAAIGKFGRYSFDKRLSVKVADGSAGFIIIIQTDKPVYRAGEVVRLRILSIDHRKLPLAKDAIGNVWVENTNHFRVAQWHNVSFSGGMIQLEMELSKEPPLGQWKIFCRVLGQETRKPFQVDEYVLPKFGVEVVPPPYVFPEETNTTWKICAQYVYGKPVKGQLRAQLTYGRFHWASEATKVLPSIDLDLPMKGCHEFTLNGRDLLLANEDLNRRPLILTAEVTEEATGVTQHANVTVRLSWSRLTLEFLKDGAVADFKPGLPHSGALMVTQPDGTPAPGESVNICFLAVNVTMREVSKGCRDFKSGPDGLIRFSVPGLRSSPSSLRVTVSDAHNFSPPLMYELRELLVKSQILRHPILRGRKSVNGPLGTCFWLERRRRRRNRALHYGKRPIMHRGDARVALWDVFHNALGREGEEQGGGRRRRRMEKEGGEEEEAMCSKASAAVTVGSGSSLPSSSSSLLMLHCAGITSCTMSSNGTSRQTHTSSSRLAYSASSAFTLCASRPESMVPVSCFSSSMLSWSSLLVLKHIIGATAPDCKSFYTLGVRMDRGKTRYFILREDNYVTCEYTATLSSTHSFAFSRANRVRATSSHRSSLMIATLFLDFLVVTTHVNIVTFFSLVVCFNFVRKHNDPVFSKVKMKDNAPAFHAAASFFFFFFTVLPDFYVVSTIYLHPLGYKVPRLQLSLPCQLPGKRSAPTFFLLNIIFYFYKDYHNVGIQEMQSSVTFLCCFYALGKFCSNLIAQVKLSLNADSACMKLLGEPQKRNCLCGSESIVLQVQVRPLCLGAINITLHALGLAENKGLCDEGKPLEARQARDSLRKSLLVTAEGQPREKSTAKYICLNGSDEGPQKHEFPLELPRNVVSGSSRGVFTLSGNVGSPVSVDKLDKLVRLPTGCGEQNLALLAPNVFVLDYLNSSGERGHPLESKLKENIAKGYQRQLNYRHAEGGYSAFGSQDPEPSLWLTAFAVRTFGRSRRFMPIDEAELSGSIRWILSNQYDNGCFPSVGRVLNSRLKGGLEGHSLAPLTAYVLISLLEAGAEIPQVSRVGAVRCLLQELQQQKQDSHTMALAAYAFSLFEDSKASELLASLRDKAQPGNGTEATLHWHENVSTAVAVETASYVVLASFKLSGRAAAKSVLPVVRWVLEQRNHDGGFVSTQARVL